MPCKHAKGASVDAVEAAKELERLLGTDKVVGDEEVIDSYRFDRSHAPHAGRPLAVVRATCTNDVQETMRFASARRIPVVVRGAGTGLSGGSLAIEGGITLSTERMRAIRVDPARSLAVVQPGALNAQVKEAAREHGLWYPPDPSSFEICSIGGNIATNAGGLCCAKYGVTSDYVLALEVVLADGRAVRLGAGTMKDVAGLDLKRLFVGSEGTLGVVTEATLRLVPAPGPLATTVALFSDVGSAGRAVSAIRRELRPALLELMDATAIGAVEKMARMGLDTTAGALLIGSSDEPGATRIAQTKAMAALAEDSGATEVAYSFDPDEAEQLMAARRMAIPAVERLGTVLIEDVGVPLDRVGELLTGIERIASERHTIVATIGHAGDGNFHPLVVFDRSDEDSALRADETFGEIMDLALGLGGTVTGEHGVGSLKLPWLASQVGEDVLDITRRIKAALDPLHILNPGKAF